MCLVLIEPAKSRFSLRRVHQLKCSQRLSLTSPSGPSLHRLRDTPLRFPFCIATPSRSAMVDLRCEPKQSNPDPKPVPRTSEEWEEGKTKTSVALIQLRCLPPRWPLRALAEANEIVSLTKGNWAKDLNLLLIILNWQLESALKLMALSSRVKLNEVIDCASSVPSGWAEQDHARTSPQSPCA